MAVKTFSEQIVDSYASGGDPIFIRNGISYQYNPDGLKDYINSGSTGPVTVTWGDVSDKPAVIAAGADAATARSAIGAGTSNLAVGTTASTAAAGNHNHAVSADVDSGLAAAANLQAAFVALSARVKALEDAV